jgi:DNA-binding transcriptional ArsR family regulator
MSSDEDQRKGAVSRHIADPRSIRALAHPARLAIINALATGEERTATQWAEVTGLSPSATAYHLKFLERHGFVETAPPPADRRERPWRATGRRTMVHLDDSTPAGAAAAATVGAAHIDTTRALAVEFVQGAHAEPAHWREAALNNADLWLTAEEFHRVAEEVAAVLEPYRKRAQRRQRSAGTRRVRVMTVVVPHPLPSE